MKISEEEYALKQEKNKWKIVWYVGVYLQLCISR